LIAQVGSQYRNVGEPAREAPSDSVHPALCEAGKFNDVAASICTNCTSGKWQPNRGRREVHCRPCHRGRCSESPGQSALSACTRCAAGTFSAVVGANSPCTECAAGQFQNAQGRSNCRGCWAGRYAADPTAIVCPSAKRAGTVEQIQEAHLRGELDPPGERASDYSRGSERERYCADVALCKHSA
jgi:hypothetical protein